MASAFQYTEWTTSANFGGMEIYKNITIYIVVLLNFEIPVKDNCHLQLEQT